MAYPGDPLALSSQGCASDPLPSLDPETMEPSGTRSDSKFPPVEEKSCLAEFTESRWYDFGISAVIIFNLVLVIQETNIRAQDMEVPRWLKIVDLVLFVVYCTDIGLRLCARGRILFRNKSGCLDVAIVGIDAVTNTLGLFDINFGSSLSLLRIFRLAKLFRLMMNMTCFEELHIMLRLMLSAARTIFWGVALMFVVLTMWAIVAVTVLHPLNREIAETTNSYDGCERCGRAFESVEQSILTFFQTIIAGDSWGQVSVVLIERHPGTFPILFLVVISMQLWLLNLVVTVMVDQAQLSREKDLDERLRKKKEDYATAEADFLSMCESLDTDQSGNISLKELMDGYEGSPEWAQTLTMMDLEKDDIALLFTLMDADNSGTVSYREFAEQLHDMAPADVGSAVAYTRALVTRFMEKDFRQYREHTYAMLTSVMQEIGSKKVGRKTPAAAEEPEAKDCQPAQSVYALRSSSWGQHREDLMEKLDAIMEDVGRLTDPVRAGAVAQGKERRSLLGKVSASGTSEAAAECARAPAKQAEGVGTAKSMPAASFNSGLALAAADVPTRGSRREPPEDGENANSLYARA